MPAPHFMQWTRDRTHARWVVIKMKGRENEQLDKGEAR